MKKLVFLRHGEIEGSASRYIGVTNAHLSEKGREQITGLASRLDGENFDRVICSPFDRCRETVQLLNRPEHIVFDERIREIDFGLWESKTFTYIKEQFPEAVSQWSNGTPEFRFPKGEKIDEFQKRIADFAQSLYSLKEERLLIVTHGGVIRHLICTLLNIPMANYLYFRVNYGRLVLLELYSEGGVLTGLNRRCIDG